MRQIPQERRLKRWMENGNNSLPDRMSRARVCETESRDECVRRIISSRKVYRLL